MLMFELEVLIMKDYVAYLDKKKELLLEERLINITMLKNMEMVVLFSNLGNCQCQRAFHLEPWQIWIVR
jgi:hypothetical protein